MLNGNLEHCVSNESAWPDSSKQFLFGNQLTVIADEVVENGVRFGSEFDYFRSSQQTLVGPVQPEGFKEDAITVHYCERYRSFTTDLHL